MSYYAELFRQWHPEHDPRHIEAYIRIEHPTLNNLDDIVLRREASIAAECIAEGGLQAAEQLALSFGLTPPDPCASVVLGPGAR